MKPAKSNWAQKALTYSYIFTPSGMSLIFCVFISLLTMFVYELHYFLNYFQINGSWKIGSYVLSPINRFLTSIFGSSDVNIFVLAAFWGSVGYIVYIISRMLVTDVNELSSHIHERKNYLWPRATKPSNLEKFFQRILFRGAVIIILIVYIANVISFFFHGKVSTLPYFNTSINQWFHLHTYMNDIVFILVEILALHGLVILVRLLIMKARIFT